MLRKSRIRNLDFFEDPFLYVPLVVFSVIPIKAMIFNNENIERFHKWYNFLIAVSMLLFFEFLTYIFISKKMNLLFFFLSFLFSISSYFLYFLADSFRNLK